MGEGTRIEWADHTFNPWSGCTKVSAGCAHCYAAALPPKMRRGAEWGPSEGRVPAGEAYWRQPLAWARKAAADGVRRRVFCASVADVFEQRAELDPWRIRLWELIKATPELDWLLVTKRPFRMALWGERHGWPANAWAGTSVEDQAAADVRVPDLLEVPARVRFLSCEPLLDEVDVSAWLSELAWVIVGGESGRHARPMHPDWARGLRDQAGAAGVPFLFKQWGEWAPAEDIEANGGTDLRAFEDSAEDGGVPNHRWKEGPLASLWPEVWRVGKKAAGRHLDGVEHNGFPAPEVPHG